MSLFGPSRAGHKLILALRRDYISNFYKRYWNRYWVLHDFLKKAIQLSWGVYSKSQQLADFS